MKNRRYLSVRRTYFPQWHSNSWRKSESYEGNYTSKDGLVRVYWEPYRKELRTWIAGKQVPPTEVELGGVITYSVILDGLDHYLLENRQRPEKGIAIVAGRFLREIIRLRKLAKEERQELLRANLNATER